MNFGQTIKKLRRERDFTQEQLAELLSISPQAVSRWETNLAMPDISLLIPLANLFSVTVDELLGRESVEADAHRTDLAQAGAKGGSQGIRAGRKG